MVVVHSTLLAGIVKSGRNVRRKAVYYYDVQIHSHAHTARHTQPCLYTAQRLMQYWYVGRQYQTHSSAHVYFAQACLSTVILFGLFQAQVRVGVIVPTTAEGEECLELQSLETEEEICEEKGREGAKEDDPIGSLRNSAAENETSLDTDLLLSDAEEQSPTPSLSRRYAQRPSVHLLLRRLLYIVICVSLMAGGALVRQFVSLDGLRGAAPNSTSSDSSCPSDSKGDYLTNASSAMTVSTPLIPVTLNVTF